MTTPPLIPPLVITGPTAAGKAELALRIAEAGGGGIVSVDSMQIYRGLEVGTAKPTSGERARAPIHLIDFVESDESYGVAQYQRAARAAIAAISAHGKLPILCGGTGLYVCAVLQGFSFPTAEDPRQQEVRQWLRAEAERDGLVDLGPVALDGTGINANASKHKAIGDGWMSRREAQPAAEVQGWLELAQAADAGEDETSGRDRRGDELPEWVTD